MEYIYFLINFCIENLFCIFFVIGFIDSKVKYKLD
jgi:hypothetical protein